MEYIEDLVLIVHLLSAVAIIGLVLIQQGKGAEAGSGFGAGAGGTVFGSSGAGNFLTRTTTLIVVVFFVTSFTLAFFAKERSEAGNDLDMPGISLDQQVQGVMGEDRVEGSGEAMGEIPMDSEVPVFEGSVDEESEIPE